MHSVVKLSITCLYYIRECKDDRKRFYSISFHHIFTYIWHYVSQFKPSFEIKFLIYFMMYFKNTECTFSIRTKSQCTPLSLMVKLKICLRDTSLETDVSYEFEYIGGAASKLIHYIVILSC